MQLGPSLFLLLLFVFCAHRCENFSMQITIFAQAKGWERGGRESGGRNIPKGVQQRTHKKCSYNLYFFFVNLSPFNSGQRSSKIKLKMAIQSGQCWKRVCVCFELYEHLNNFFKVFTSRCGLLQVAWVPCAESRKLIMVLCCNWIIAYTTRWF